MVRLGSLIELVKGKINVDEYYMVHQTGRRLSCDQQCKCLLSIISQLADLGTYLDIQDAYGNTPLVYALQLGCPKSDIIKFIEKGADVNKSNDRGSSPLFYALKFDRDKDIVDKLLDYGADVNAKDESGMTPLMCALMQNCLREVILRLIYATSDINCHDKYGKTHLVYALQYCQDEFIILKLIDLGAHVTIIDSHGNTVLHHASGSTWECISSFIFNHGICKNTKNLKGETPLFVAVKDYDYIKVQSLLSLGCDPNISDNDKKTPLHIARSKDIINWLVYFGSNLKAKDKYNFTPFDSYLNVFRWESAECIIKHFLLSSDENEIHQSLVERLECAEYLRRFIEDYKIEINKMKTYNITNNLSFFNFCNLKKTKYSKFINISKSDYLYKYEQILEIFPAFFEIIFMKMKDNEVEKQRNDLLKNLEKVRIMSVPHFGSTYSVEINYDCIESVARHLDHNELYNLVRASL